MNIFLSATSEDTNFLPTFAALVRTPAVSSVKFKTDFPTSIEEVKHWCRYYKADAMVITNPETLKLVLHDQVDFRPPNNRRGLTLDDYQGSLLSLVVDGKRLECVVLNPLEHLVTVPYGKFLVEKFLSKILAPEKWLPDVSFRWQVATLETADAICTRLEQSRITAVDIETPTSGEWAELRGINCVGYAGLFANMGRRNEASDIECYVFPFEEWSYSYIRRINDNRSPKVTQRGLYDNSYFLRWGLPLRNWYWDTYHLFHSWLAELPRDLAIVAAFSVRNVRYWKDDGKSGDLSDYYRYNARDCWATLCGLLGLLRDAPEWAIVNYTEHEFPSCFPAITCAMEGFLVDEPLFKQVFAQLEKKKEEELREIQVMVGSPVDPTPILRDKEGKFKIQYFNPNSAKQNLQLFHLLGFKNYTSTDKAATLKARAAHPLTDRVIGDIVDWKKNAKVLSSYIQEKKLWDPLATFVKYTGVTTPVRKGGPRLYYELDPGGTVTGRYASKSSSFWCGFQIQNVPGGETVKQCLLADDGWLLGEGDYAQSEARCVGYLSGETKLIELVEGPHDYHAWNASAFFGVPYERIYDDSAHKQLDKPLRDLSKRTNHGANYNMGEGVMLDTMGPKYVSAAKRLLGLPASLPLRKVCAFLLNVYETTYPRVKRDWYAAQLKTVKITGCLVSPLGWTRKFFGNPDGNKHILNGIVAHAPQNLSVGIINKVFFRLWHDQIYGDLGGKFRIKAQIHDSIPYQYRPEYPEVPGIVADRMQWPVQVTDCFGITRTMVIPVDMASGKRRWSELKS